MGWPCFLQDIKSPNVLIKKGDAKVADVGLSQLLSRSFANSCSFGVGTFSWAATELLLGSHPVSLPCLQIEICTLHNVLFYRLGMYTSLR